MKHEMVLLGKEKSSFIEDGIKEYLARLKHYTTINLKVVKEKKTGRSSKTEEEGRLLLDHVPAGWLKVALDPKGKLLSSEELAEKISGWENCSVKGVSYLIGGPLGLSAEVLNSADMTLSLSRMTFTHDMTRMILIEQIYRAYTIKAGEKYHK